MMYVWSSNALADWGKGTIAVVASSVEEARRKAWERAEEYCKDAYDEDELRANFVADIASEPREMDVLFIHGRA